MEQDFDFNNEEKETKFKEEKHKSDFNQFLYE